MSKIRKSLTALGLSGAMAGSLLLLSTGTASAGSWQCTVPPGMTWDWVTMDADCGIPNGIAYDVVSPTEGSWACMVPVGWNWTATQTGTLCSTDRLPTTEYQLTKA